MSTTQPAVILRQLEQTGAADVELLARFTATKDAPAFAELVRRYGALVLGVCRRVTGHPQDAEDAFQATFLVLAQKASTLRSGVPLGSWLHGVAYRVAWRARRSAVRRRAREVPVSVMPEPHAPAPTSAMPELTPILDEELAALPACYRDAIVLCDLQGASREEAAAALSIPEGTLSSRLANGRKKLAARLMKRGVSLSVAALATSIATAQASVTVPNELLTRTCGLVADYAAGGALPSSLARLADGGFTVRKMLMIGTLMMVAVAGAVFAARPRDGAPPIDSPKPLVIAQNPEADLQPEPKPEPKPAPDPKPGDKVSFTTKPRLIQTLDVRLKPISEVSWRNDGHFLLVQGVGTDAGTKDQNMAIVLPDVLNPRGVRKVEFPLHRSNSVARFLPDNKTIVADRREYELLSGRHRLYFYEVVSISDWGLRREVELEATDISSYVFAPDCKTFRTMRQERDDKGTPTKLEVLEVDAATGKTGKSFLKVDYENFLYGRNYLSPDAKRLAVPDKELTKITVYDVDRGVKLSEYKFPAEDLAVRPSFSNLEFSQDGRLLVVQRSVGQTVVVNTDTGEALPPLEMLEKARTSPHPHAFSGDGRLLALACSEYQEPKPKKGTPFDPNNFGPPKTFLTVWDTQTGKVLKMWPRTPRVAFCPTRPVLAILEPNGEYETRVGFWDFSAEVEKK